MDSTIYMVALGILILVVFALVWVAVLFAITWFIGKLVRLFLSIPGVENLLSKLWRLGETWWEDHKDRMARLWDASWELIIDPILFSYIIFALFNRITSLTDYTNAHPESNIWQMLTQDVDHSMTFYYFFVAVFFLWIIGKGYRHRQQARNDRVMINSLKNIESKLGCKSPTDVGTINAIIRDNLKRIKERR